MGGLKSAHPPQGKQLTPPCIKEILEQGRTKMLKFKSNCLTLIFLSFISRENSIQCPRRFLDEINQDPSVSKSNWFHVVIFGVFFKKLIRVFSIDLSKMMSKFLKVLKFKQLFLRLNWFVFNWQLISPVHRLRCLASSNKFYLVLVLF